MGVGEGFIPTFHSNISTNLVKHRKNSFTVTEMLIRVGCSTEEKLTSAIVSGELTTCRIPSANFVCQVVALINLDAYVRLPFQTTAVCGESNSIC